MDTRARLLRLLAGIGVLVVTLAVTFGLALAVSTMAINMARAGVPDSLGIMVPFLMRTFMNLTVGIVLLRNIDSTRAGMRAA